MMFDPEIQPFQRWGIDFIGPLPTAILGGPKFIIVAVDYATSWVIARASHTATALFIAKFIKECIFNKFGPPNDFISDRGSNFLSNVMVRLRRQYAVNWRFTSGYHPQTNGKTEANNKILKTMLAKALFDAEVPLAHWSKYLPNAILNMRTRLMALHGMSPYQLTFGILPRHFSDDIEMRPMDATIADPVRRHQLLQSSREAGIELAYHLAENYTNRFNLDREEQFVQGDYVLVRNEAHHALEGNWFGPYKIENVLNGTYWLSMNGRRRNTAVHGNRL